MSNAPYPVCVYCGARDGNSASYGAAATELGEALATGGCQLVYGAAAIGLMGRVASAALAAGGDTLGVIPEHLLNLEIGKRDLTRFVVTETLHERKKVMFMNAAAIVVMPGGAGTLDEFFEVLTWRQLGMHQKPIILLNTDSYWTPLIAMIDHIVDQGFAETSVRSSVQVAHSVPEVMALLQRARGRTAY